MVCVLWIDVQYNGMVWHGMFLYNVVAWCITLPNVVMWYCGLWYVVEGSVVRFRMFHMVECGMVMKCGIEWYVAIDVVWYVCYHYVPADGWY